MSVKLNIFSKRGAAVVVSCKFNPNIRSVVYLSLDGAELGCGGISNISLNLNFYMFYSKICIVLPACGNTLIWEEHKV